MSQNAVFCAFRTDAGRVVKNEPLWKCAQSSSGPTLRRANSYIGHITPIFGKNPFFGVFSTKKFTRRYLVPLMTKEGLFYNFTTGHKIRSEQFVDFFLNHHFDPLRNQRCEKHNKKFAAMKFQNWGKHLIFSNELSRTYSEKNKI